MRGKHDVAIQTICELFRLTPRAVRYYETIGLIEAGRGQGNIRVFDGEARERLRWISLLRRVGVPLADVSRVLGVLDERALVGGEVRDVLVRRSEVLRRELAAVEDEIATLQNEPQVAEPAQVARRSR